MSRTPSRILFAALACVAGNAFAQDNAPSELDEIVVTGTRISDEDLALMPAVTIARRADFLALSVTLENDTREADTRKREMHETLRNLVADAARQGMSMGYGTDFLVPVTAQNYQLPLGSGSRADTSRVSLYLKRPLGPTDDVATEIDRLEKFVKGARVVGRTEVEADDDIALSVVNPERYRYEIVPLIAADARKLQATVGPGCRVNLSGLASRVSWERSGIAELTLYLPYKVDITDCQ
jgi:hypothetical protein